MYEVLKRSGDAAPFELSKIEKAIEKAFIACDTQYNENVLDFLALKVTADFEPKVQKNLISVEDIQDSVEAVLIQAGYTEVAKSYILYRKQHEKKRQMESTFLDYKKLVNEYIDEADWRVKENSTVTHTLGGLILSNSGAVTANYWLSEVYDEEISKAHKNGDIHIHDLSMLSGYCAGWSLRQLIQEGLGGVEGRISSKPAGHLSTLTNQMVNFLGILQNEWAGAQAFSSFDTYLAPFVKKDNLSYKETKQCIQSFVFGLNTPSRWGCVPETTKVLTPSGFKSCKELKKGDVICTWENGILKTAPIDNIIYKDNAFDVLYRFSGKNYNQTVTPEHRCIVQGKETKSYIIKQAKSIYKENDIIMPLHISDVWLEHKLVSETDIKFAVNYYAGAKKSVNGTINPKFLYLNKEQSKLFIDTWAKETGFVNEYKIRCKYPDDLIKDALILIMIRAGYIPYIHETVEGKFVCTDKRFSAKIIEQKEIRYTGKVWCPNTKAGTAIFKDEDDNIFISGNCQAPFTNITLDWVAPPDLKDMPAIVGGKEMDFTYGDCQKEMDMVNKAFIEVMLEGDANGRGFQYPIPTYSITKDFDWSETENNKLLFEMTAKYGTPYFSNYVNSDMNPQDARSMCPMTPDTQVVVQANAGETKMLPIGEVYEDYIKNNTYYTTWTFHGWKTAIPVKMPKTDIYEISTDNGKKVRFGKNHLQPAKGYGTLHADELSVGMELLFVEFFNDKILPVYHKITNIKKIKTDDDCLYCFEVNNEDHLFALANGLITHNCRLRLDLRELRKKSGGYFGSGESTGSVGVVTINLPRIAYLAKDKEDFYKRLERLMDISARSIRIKRKTITKLLEEGLYPYTKRYLGNFNNHFSTLGLIGFNEVGLNAKWLGKDLSHKETQDFAIEVLNFMRNKLSDYQELYGDLYNLEATPAESTTYRFAKHDKELFPDIITANENGTPYYTNSSHLPVGYTEDIFSALDIQDELQTLYTSGTVFHGFLGEKLPSWKSAADLVRKIAENYRLPYYTLSPTYSICRDHGYITGEEYTCPQCGKDTEVYSRITGYYRPVQNFNDGKAQEFRDRKTYVSPAILFDDQPSVSGNKNADNQCCEINKEDKYTLFVTKTCPKCKIASSILNKAGIQYEKVYVEENMERARALELKQAPTLMKNNEKIVDLPAIKEYVNKLDLPETEEKSVVSFQN